MLILALAVRFPYRDVIGEPWENVLREFVPRVATAKVKEDYERQL
jgi:hypothetical protein